MRSSLHLISGIGLALTIGVAAASSASAGTTNPRQGHFDIEAEVTCTAGTNTVVSVEADIDVDEGASAPWAAATDYVALGATHLAASTSAIGLHPAYVGCLGTPAVAFRLTSANGPGAATATYGGSTRFKSTGSVVNTAGPFSVTSHTDFADITYSAPGFYNWTIRATSRGVSDTAPVLTVRAN